MNPTAIQWTWRRGENGQLVPKSGSTWNPAVGCRRCSTGCENCYAERLTATRLSKHKHYLNIAKMTDKGPRFTGEHRLIVERLTEPLRAKKPRNIFVCDLSDLFFEGNTFEEIAVVYGIMGLAKQHTFQVLTKRTARALEFYTWVTTQGGDAFAVCAKEARRLLPEYRAFRAKKLPELPWPLSNVQLGTSVEDQRRANERIPLLLRIPAAVRFLSVEPLLEAVDLTDLVWTEGTVLRAIARAPIETDPAEISAALQAELSFAASGGGRRLTHEELVASLCTRHGITREGEQHFDALRCDVDGEDDGEFQGRTIDWVIVGGESGPNARPFNIDWARALVKECKSARVPIFVKQIGARPFTTENGVYHVADSHGGDPAEWPLDLRVRQLVGEVRS